MGFFSFVLTFLPMVRVEMDCNLSLRTAYHVTCRTNGWINIWINIICVGFFNIHFHVKKVNSYCSHGSTTDSTERKVESDWSD